MPGFPGLRVRIVVGASGVDVRSQTAATGPVGGPSPLELSDDEQAPGSGNRGITYSLMAGHMVGYIPWKLRAEGLAPATAGDGHVVMRGVDLLARAPLSHKRGMIISE